MRLGASGGLIGSCQAVRSYTVLPLYCHSVLLYFYGFVLQQIVLPQRQLIFWGGICAAPLQPSWCGRLAEGKGWVVADIARPCPTIPGVGGSLKGFGRF